MVKTAVIYDIDETLAHTKDEIHKLLESGVLNHTQTLGLKRRMYVLDFYTKTGKLKERLWGIKRPHIDDLLRYSFRNFDYVMIWSAGTKAYVERMVKVLFLDAGHPMPHYIFSREDCHDNDGDLIKPLDLIFEMRPELDGVLKRENMVIIDNKESNFDFNVENGLLIDDFAPKINIESLLQEDKNLLAAIKYLERRLEKMHQIHKR